MTSWGTTMASVTVVSGTVAVGISGRSCVEEGAVTVGGVSIGIAVGVAVATGVAVAMNIGSVVGVGDDVGVRVAVGADPGVSVAAWVRVGVAETAGWVASVPHANATAKKPT